MTAYPSLKRWLAAGLTLVVLGAALFFIARNGPDANPLEPNARAAQGGKGGKNAQDWNMYGGTPTRNMVNLAVKGMPVQWTDKNDKLIPTPSAQNVVGAQTIRQLLADRSQDRVTTGMAVSVVDRLKVIDVDQNQTVWPIEEVNLLNGLLHLQVDIAAIRYSGQGI